MIQSASETPDLYSAYVRSHVASIRNPKEELAGETHPYFRKNFLKLIPKSRQTRILDVGCGFGSLISFLRSEGFTNVMGIDVSEEQVALATRMGVPGISQADLVPYLRDLSEQLDVIFAVDILEHLDISTLLDALSASRAALKDGGRIIIQTANADGPFGSRYRYGDLTHKMAFTSSSISQALRLAGFRSIHVYPIEPAVHGVKSLVRWLLWRLVRLVLVGYLAAETGVVKGHILSQNLIAVAYKSA